MSNFEMHNIPVVFDVNAPDREAAAQYLSDTLADADLVYRHEESQDVTHIESWWMAAQQDKAADNNDNDPYVLVNSSELTKDGFATEEEVVSWVNSRVDQV